MPRPISKLADPAWIASAIAFTKDIAILQESQKSRVTAPYVDPNAKKNPRGRRPPKAAGQGADEEEA